MPQIEAVQEKEPEIKGSMRKNQGITLKIKIANALYADFDIFGFVRNSIDYAEWRETVGNQLIEVLEEQAINISRYKIKTHEMTEEMKNKIHEFKKTSIFGEREAGERETGENEMALPLYNLDLTYNIFKRVRRNAQSEFSIPVEIKEVLNRIHRIYKMVEEELQYEEDEYRDMQKSINLFKYRDNFVKDPYVKKFEELLNDESAKEEFLKQMKMLYLGAGKLDSPEQISSSLKLEE